MNKFYEYCDEEEITGNFREALYHQLMSEGKTNPTHEEVDMAWVSILDDTQKKVLDELREIEQHLQRRGIGVRQ